MRRVLVFHQPFPWSVWLMYPDNSLGWQSTDYRRWESEMFDALSRIIPQSDMEKDPDAGTGCYFCIRLKNEADIALVKLLVEGA